MIASLALIACLAAPVAAAAEPAEDDLVAVPGPDGAVAIWLELGPIAAPLGIRRGEGGVAGWDPLDAGELSEPPREGERGPGGRWRLHAEDGEEVRLSSGGPAVTYLAALLRSDEARRVLLSVGSHDGVEIWHDGRPVLRRDLQRPFRADTDRVELELPAGDSLVVVRLWRGRGRRWRFRLGLLDEQHLRARHVRVVIPGAGDQAPRAFRRCARLDLARWPDLSTGTALARAWLDFPGGRPVLADRTAALSFAGPGSPAKSEIELECGAGGPVSYLLTELEASGERAPWRIEVGLDGRRIRARIGLRMDDLARLSEARGLLDRASERNDVPRTSLESAAWRVDHLRGLIESGDGDFRYIGRESRRALQLAEAVAEGEDPFADERGLQRRGYRSSVDGRLHHYALYVPHAWRDEGEGRFSLVVALHGLNGTPVQMMQILFGEPLEEDESRRRRSRYPRATDPAPMFAVAPNGFGSSGYRAYGEVDLWEVIERVEERYRIHPDKIYVTGMSMGGIGAASLPLHYPGRFAAAVTLCGYHSLSVYSSLQGVELEPWERFLAEFRSNASWADNGRHLPLHVVHGTRDNPRHSEVLVEAYRERGFDVTYETPDSDHDVWSERYADLWAFRHLRAFRRPAHPRHVTLRTARLRYRRNRWLRLNDVADSAAWARIDAVWKPDGSLEIETDNATALTVERDAELAGDGDPVFSIDGQPVMARQDPPGEYRFSLRDDRWFCGTPPACEGLCKRPGLSGPIGDALYEPLLFVYGTADPDETALALRLVEKLRVPQRGTDVRWPIKADVEIDAEDIENHSLVLVGTPRGNSLLDRIDERLPIRAGDGWIEAGGRCFEGETTSAAFIHPNPLNPDRYVVVHTAASVAGLFYAAHLPELLPDWVIYDASDWGRAGGLVLDERELLAAGFFDDDWRFRHNGE
ncbi:MAG: alpha/beta hydrolase-fold protein [Polyangia bacterium]